MEEVGVDGGVHKVLVTQREIRVELDHLGIQQKVEEGLHIRLVC